MPVTPRYRRVLKGVVRAQTREAIKSCEQLLRAFAINPELLLFTPPGHTGDATTMQFIVSGWKSTLEALKQVG